MRRRTYTSPDWFAGFGSVQPDAVPEYDSLVVDAPNAIALQALESKFSSPRSAGFFYLQRLDPDAATARFGSDPTPTGASMRWVRPAEIGMPSA
jgi:hypothetical protein